MTAVLAAVAGFRPSGSGVHITDQVITKSVKGTATASYSIVNNRNVTNQDGTVVETWLTGGTISDYEVEATFLSGVTPTGTFGSWLNCSTTRTWSISNSAQDNSTITGVFRVDIRAVAAPGTILDSATISLSATSREPLSP
jgi:hypothetical protein